LAIETRGYSYSATQTQLEFNLDNRFLRDLRVRQAIAHAIDRKVIVDAVWYGYAIPAPSPISPLLKRFDAEDVETYPFDLATANRLLDEAGFPRGAGGNRFDLTIDPNPYNPGFIRLGSYLRQALARVGINATVRSLTGLRRIRQTGLCRSRLRSGLQLVEQHIRSHRGRAARVLVEELQKGPAVLERITL
jgi:peptide/nickel transport system substrate-binding protein